MLVLVCSRKLISYKRRQLVFFYVFAFIKYMALLAFEIRLHNYHGNSLRVVNVS